MALTGVPQITNLFDPDDDDFDEAGTLGLHLGVLRRFAQLALRDFPAAMPPAPER